MTVPEFRTLWLAQAQSRIGDQLARVALALLVFDRTSSAALTALVYALTFLPPLLTAPLLAGLADRYPRRTVLVVVDLTRGVLVAAMAVPGLPLGVVAVLLVLVTCPQPLFSAARNAVLPTLLPGERFSVGMSIVNTTDYLSQIAGFALGGVMVGLLGGPYPALAVNAVTFLVSAALIRRGIREHRAAPPAPSRATVSPARYALAGIGVLRRDRRLAGLAGLVWVSGLFVVPEALAAPYASQIGVGPAGVGVLMAADLVGAVVGALVVVRLPAALRQRLMVPLAVATGVPLVVSALMPSLLSAVTLWACTGAFGGYLTLAQIRFTRAVPDALRARAVGVASAGLQTSQGLAFLLAGAVADAVAPAVVIAGCGALGSLIAALLGLCCRPHTVPEVAG
jgi:predicted MFS family arabinose efflux permease